MTLQCRAFIPNLVVVWVLGLDRCDSGPQGCYMTLNENLEDDILEVIVDMNITLDVIPIRRKAINEGGRYYHQSETSQVLFHQLTLSPNYSPTHLLSNFRCDVKRRGEGARVTRRPCWSLMSQPAGIANSKSLILII